MSLTDIKSFSREELTEYICGLGFPRFRADQIYSWLHLKGVSAFSEMTNLPKTMIEKLSSICYISVANIEKKLVSRYDNTIKYLFSFDDGECVEAVVMDYHHGYSMCLSTQVGCKMGCTFCATGKGGFTRNLTPSEILSQIHTAQNDLDIRISNIVLMGMGEPLDNFGNVVKFIRLVTDEKGLCIGARHITLSTCGLVPKIYELADLHIPINLALSLHAPTDEMRSKTMPVNNKYPVKSVIVMVQNNADDLNIDNVVNLKNLRRYLRKQKSPIKLSKKEMKQIYIKLIQSGDNISNRKHLKNIKKTQKQLKKGICPRCGNKLIERESIYGNFIGCSNYPKCTFKMTK